MRYLVGSVTRLNLWLEPKEVEDKMPFPSTKIARQARIVELLQTRRVRSQAELAQYLTDDGMKVTQATLSRDLVEIGADVFVMRALVSYMLFQTILRVVGEGQLPMHA